MMAARRVLLSALAAAVLLTSATVTTSMLAGQRVGLAVQELEEGAVLSPAGVARLAVTAANQATLDNTEVLVDGVRIETRRDASRLVLDDLRLPEGPHKLVVRAPSSLPVLPGVSVERRFSVDNTAPTLTVEKIAAKSPREPITVRGKADGADSVWVGDQRVPVNAGAFEASLTSPPANVSVEARDAAGNAHVQDIAVRIPHPGMRAVHMSAVAWATAELREPVLQMVREKRIDAVQLDVKDESGEIGYASEVPLAKEIGATFPHYDARAVIDQLHRAGVRVVARLVAFRDPILARASWDSGRKERVIQTASGKPWTGSYGHFAFTNFADRAVRDYNLALAREAAALGFDDVLFDYIRRPDGPLGQMRFPGLNGSAEESIVSFLREAREVVRPQGAYLGASVFGIAARHGQQVAQDIRAMAAEVDYLAPMVYPSHWGPGEYGVDDPDGQPKEIVHRSVADFVAIANDSGATVIPWLQAFSLNTAYGPDDIAAQIAGSTDAGAPSFLLWNAGSKYAMGALPAR